MVNDVPFWQLKVKNEPFMACVILDSWHNGQTVGELRMFANPHQPMILNATW